MYVQTDLLRGLNVDDVLMPVVVADFRQVPAPLGGTKDVTDRDRLTTN